MTEDDLSHVPSGSKPATERLADAAGKTDVSADLGLADEAETTAESSGAEPPADVDASVLLPLLLDRIYDRFDFVRSEESKSYRPTHWELLLLARKLCECDFECRWMSFVTRGSEHKIWNIVAKKLGMIAEELGDVVVDRIFRAVDEQERRRMGGVVWRLFLNDDANGYDERLFQGADRTSTVSEGLIGELGRLVASRFPELSTDELSLALFRAADKAAIEALPMPACEHIWQPTSLPLPNEEREPFERCAVCGALRTLQLS